MYVRKSGSHVAVKAWVWDLLTGIFDEIRVFSRKRLTFPNVAYVVARYVEFEPVILNPCTMTDVSAFRQDNHVKFSDSGVDIFW